MTEAFDTPADHGILARVPGQYIA